MGWDQGRDVWIGYQVILGALRNWLLNGLTIVMAYIVYRILSNHSNCTPKSCIWLSKRGQILEMRAQIRITLGAAVICSIWH